MTFKKGNRVILQSDFINNSISIPAETVATVVMVLDDPTVIIRYGYDDFNDRQLVVGIPYQFIRLASEDDLEDVDYKGLVSPIYFIDEKLLVSSNMTSNNIKQGDVGTIKEYKLSLNEKDDLLTIDFSNFSRSFSMSFVETYLSPYDEELEAQLGEQIDFKKVEKNYHLIGARMFFRGSNPDDVVILEPVPESLNLKEDQYLVSLVSGEQEVVRKSDLTPITDLEMFPSVGNYYFIRPQFAVGKNFKAKDEVSKHALLNEIFQPGDVVQIAHVDQVQINSNDDTVGVWRTGIGNPIIVSVTELSNYFEPYKGMIKKGIKAPLDEVSFTQEKIIKDPLEEDNSFAKVEEEILANYKELEPLEEKENKVVLMMPTIKTKEEFKHNVRITEALINGYTFKSPRKNEIVVDAHISSKKLDLFILSAQKFKEIIEED